MDKLKPTTGDYRDDLTAAIVRAEAADRRVKELEATLKMISQAEDEAIVSPPWESVLKVRVLGIPDKFSNADYRFVAFIAGPFLPGVARRSVQSCGSTWRGALDSALRFFDETRNARG